MSTQNSPAPSDDDREAVARIIEDTVSVRSGVDDYEVDNADEISGKILAYLARRSPIPAPSNDDREWFANFYAAHLPTQARANGSIPCECGYGGAASYASHLASAYAAARRSPVPPPEDVTTLIVEILLEGSDHVIGENGRGGYRCEKCDAEFDWQKAERERARRHEIAPLVQRLTAALRAPVPVESGALRSFVEDLAGHGVRFDLNPTVDSRRGAFAYLDYIARIDQSVRERATEALHPTREEGQ